MSITEDQRHSSDRPARTNTALSEREQDVVRRLSGGFGWPTVLLTFALLAIEFGTVALWALGVIPLAVGFAINSVASYAWYTVHHDATHKAISGRSPKLRWVEVSCGNIAGFAMLLEFRGYAASHLRHHAHTNTPEDPDILIAGPGWQVPVKWAVATVLFTIAALPWGDRVVVRLLGRLGLPLPTPTSQREVADRNRQRRLVQLGLLVLLASIPLGWFWPVLLLWWLPSRVGILILMAMFQWLPHFPFDRTDRFGATRVTLWPGSTWMLLHQDRHLIHHLYPSIPWYRYRSAYRELLPLLKENHAIIEGRGTSPRVPIHLRENSTAS